MKAVIARDYSGLDALGYEDWPDPVPGSGEVLIRSQAIGANFADGWMVQGLYQVKPEPPFVPGMEVVGIVEAVGEDVTAYKAGDRVGAFGGMGCFAEKVVMGADKIMPLPADMDAAEACALIVGYGTGYHALKQRAALQPGETVCVTGASGLTGSATVQLAKAMGARVIAVASTDAKRKVALDAGADEAIGYDDLQGELKRLTGGKGVDVAFETVGGDAFDALSRRMAWNGRLLVVGFASGTIPKLPVNLTLVKGYSVVGVFWGAFAEKEPEANRQNIAEIMAMHAAGKLRPVIDGRYKLADAGDALKRMQARNVTGKVILLP